MRIGALARELGWHPDTVRKAERTGLLPPAPRDANGHRRYTSQDVEAIRQILFGRRGAGSVRQPEGDRGAP